MTEPATLSTLREINASVVLQELWRDPPLSRAEIARRARMTKPTVAHALDLLLNAGLVREAEPPSEIHYGAVYFAPVPDISHVLGLDIGTRFVRGAISDLTGATLVRHDERITDSHPATVTTAVTAVQEGLLAALGRVDAPIEVAVVGVPGVVDPEEGVIRQSNRAELESTPIRAELRQALGLATEVENDINLAALGEQALGAGRGVADFAFLSVGAGVGAGLVLGGRPHRGHRGAAGEVDDPVPGAAEAEDSPSGDALVTVAHTWIADAGETLLTAPTTPEAIFAAATAGDALAARLLHEESRRIAVRIAEICRVTDVELVVLGGGIGLAATDLLPDIRAEADRLLRYPPRIEISHLADGPVLAGALAHGTRLASRSVSARRIAAAR